MMKDRVRKLKTIHAGLTAQIERGGISGGAATGGFPKKPRGTSSKAGVARRPSTAGKRPTIGASSSQHDISGFISNASATLGGVSQSAGGKDYTP
jgi:myosin heavy subunit